LPLNTKTKVYFETYYNNGRNPNPITVNKPTLQNSNIEFVSTKEEADVALLWLIPTGGSLFTSQGKPIELNLSKNKIDVTHVNEIINAKPTIVAINFSSPWVIDEIDNGKAKTVLATFGTTQEALLDIISGAFKPTGKMPFSIPVSSQVVLDNKSDVPGALEPKGYALYKFGDGISY
jgi:beta-glucosidase